MSRYRHYPEKSFGKPTRQRNNPFLRKKSTASNYIRLLLHFHLYGQEYLMSQNNPGTCEITSESSLKYTHVHSNRESENALLVLYHLRVSLKQNLLIFLELWCTILVWAQSYENFALHNLEGNNENFALHNLEGSNENFALHNLEGNLEQNKTRKCRRTVQIQFTSAFRPERDSFYIKPVFSIVIWMRSMDSNLDHS